MGAAQEALNRVTAKLIRTWPQRPGRGQVLLKFGQFANVIDIGRGQGVAVCTDGVGSKALVASALGKYDTIGIDCVAMNVNDLVCVGAEPLTLVDYVSVERVDTGMLASIAEGLAVGAERAGVSVSGGEIAELPDMIRNEAGCGTGFDLVGTAVGGVAHERILVGDKVEPGDAVIGIASSGVHANGLTLARKVFFEDEGLTVTDHVPEFGRSAGEELLEPTHIYVSESLRLMNELESLRALIHITSDGFLNLTRVEANGGFELDALPELPPVFRSLAERGRVPAHEMFSVFNMGIGMCAVVAENDADAAISTIAAVDGKKAWRIGSVTDAAGTVSIPKNSLDGRGLVGTGKAFRPVPRPPFAAV